MKINYSRSPSSQHHPGFVIPAQTGIQKFFGTEKLSYILFLSQAGARKYSQPATNQLFFPADGSPSK
jgi:hypothetical protein